MAVSGHAVRGGGQFTKDTRFICVRPPEPEHGYPQRIDIYNAIQRRGSADRLEVLAELLATNHRGGNGKVPDEVYCRTELRDMWNSGWIDVTDIGSGRMPPSS